MSDRKDTRQDSTGRDSMREQTMFDAWLRRGLAEAFHSTLQEPLPPELMRLLDDEEDTRAKH